MDRYGTIRLTPSSTAFCTINSILSPLGSAHKQRDRLLRFGIRRVAAYDPAGHGFLLHGFHRAVKIHPGTVTQGNTFADTQTQNTSRVMRVFSGKVSTPSCGC